MKELPNEHPSSIAETAKRLRAARKKVYPTAAAAAKALGFLPVTVRAHENGQNGFQFSHAAAYARAYGVDVGWLVSGDGSAPQGQDAVRPAAPGVELTGLPGGKARLRFDGTTSMATALKVLALLEGGE